MEGVMIDQGKSAKKMGKTSPYMARRPHPDKEKATPAKPKNEKKREWKLSYEVKWWRTWKVREEKFKTERSRDQALKSWERKCVDHPGIWRNAMKVQNQSKMDV